MGPDQRHITRLVNSLVRHMEVMVESSRALSTEASQGCRWSACCSRQRVHFSVWLFFLFSSCAQRTQKRRTSGPCSSCPLRRGTTCGVTHGRPAWTLTPQLWSAVGGNPRFATTLRDKKASATSLLTSHAGATELRLEATHGARQSRCAELSSTTCPACNAPATP